MKFKSTFLLIIFSFSIVFAQNIEELKIIRSKIRENEKQKYSKQFELANYPTTENQNSYDIKSYILNLKLDPTEKLLTGIVTASGISLIDNFDKVDFDLYTHMTISSVQSGQNDLNFTHENGIVSIELSESINHNEKFEVAIYYSGNPEETGDGAFGWSKHDGGREDIIWTLSEPFGAASWWPSKIDPSDKADSVFLNITVPDNLIAASNGLLVNTIDNGDGNKTFKWETRYPVSGYLISLAISNYETINDTYVGLDGKEMPLVYYIYPELMQNAEADMLPTKNMLEVFAEKFGEYPFIEEKYGNALFPWGGGMEHQTLTSYGSVLITGNRTYDWLNAHEVAHQWFGDNISLSSWAHVWLKEGLSSYAEALWFEHLDGKEGYHEYMASQWQPTFTGSLFIQDSTNPGPLFSNTVYDKGSWAIHMLRGVLGDNIFFKAIKSYATDIRFSGRCASTEDFQKVVEDISGMELGWFFNQWVYNAGRPSYVYNWETANNNGYKTTLNLLQETSLTYKMPIMIRLTDGLNTEDVVVWDSLQTQSFEFSTAFEPTQLIVDPEMWILKNIAEGESYSFGGQVIDRGTGQPIEGATVVWEGPFDQTYGNPLNYGTTLTNSTGSFSFIKGGGSYILSANKEGYTPSRSVELNLNQPDENLNLYLSQPEIEFGIDSLFIPIGDAQPVESEIFVSNAGSGELFYQTLEGKIGNINLAPTNRQVTPEQITTEDFLNTSKTYSSNKMKISADNLRVFVNDQEGDTNGPYDLHEFSFARSGRDYVFELTTHSRPFSFDKLRVNIYFDTDLDYTTGSHTGYMGADVLIAIGNLGNGFGAYLLRYNEDINDFSYIGMAKSFDSDLGTKSIQFSEGRGFFNSASAMGVFVVSYEINNLIHSLDYIPSSNQGFFLVNTEDYQFLDLKESNGFVSNDQASAITLSLTSEDLAKGINEALVTVVSTAAGGMNIKHIPLTLDNITEITLEDGSVPNEFSLKQNYPNPFNPLTTIQYGIPAIVNGEISQVILKIYNVLGSEVATLVNEHQSPGNYSITFDAKDLSSGLYFYKIQAGKFTGTKKMILLK